MSDDYETRRRKEIDKVLWAAAIILAIVAISVYIGLKDRIEDSIPFSNQRSILEED